MSEVILTASGNKKLAADCWRHTAATYTLMELAAALDVFIRICRITRLLSSRGKRKEMMRNIFMRI